MRISIFFQDDRSERLTAEDAKLLIERTEEFLELVNYLSSC
ncbi:MAG: hypothetical protein WCO29_21495 [Nostocales cyanobacterium ELA583]|jgi:hypothetical protein